MRVRAGGLGGIVVWVGVVERAVLVGDVMVVVEEALEDVRVKARRTRCLSAIIVFGCAG